MYCKSSVLFSSILKVPKISKQIPQFVCVCVCIFILILYFIFALCLRYMNERERERICIVMDGCMLMNKKPHKDKKEMKKGGKIKKKKKKRKKNQFVHLFYVITSLAFILPVLITFLIYLFSDSSPEVDAYSCRNARCHCTIMHAFMHA